MIFRHRVVWTGFTGQPGYTNLYYLHVDGGQQAAADASRAFMADFLSSPTTTVYLPTSVKLTFDAIVDVLSDDTGDLMNSHAVTQPNVVQGVSNAEFSSATGACVTWLTGGIRGNPPRRVRGRTFFVPLSSDAFSNDGSLDTTALANFTAAANLHVSHAANPVIWARPTAVGASDGEAFEITAARIQDKTAILTSRRD